MLSKQGEYFPSGLFSTEHIVAVLICLAMVVICVYLVKDMQWGDLEPIFIGLGVIVSLLVLIELIIDAYIHNTKVENMFPLSTTLVFVVAFWLARLNNKKLKNLSNIILTYFGLAFGTTFLIFTVPSITNYPIFHIKSLMALISNSIMIFCGAILVVKNQVKLNKKTMFVAVVIMLDIMIDCLIINTMFNVNFLNLISPSSLNLSVLNNLYLFSNGIYSFVMFLIYIIPLFLVLILNKIYNELKVNAFRH